MFVAGILWLISIIFRLLTGNIPLDNFPFSNLENELQERWTRD